jgi:glutamate-ammonia-ligase adenylyltransferase
LSTLALLERLSPAVARQIRHAGPVATPLAARLQWEAEELRHRALAAAEDALRSDDPAGIRRALRQLKYEVVAGLILADFELGPAAVEPATRVLSDLADALCEGALRWAQGRLVARHGAPAPWGPAGGVAVLALGKHGAQELNYSSDIDIVVLVAGHEGETEGPRTIDTRRFADRIVAELSSSLAEPTEDGFCFRVDLDLRPDGAVAPPSTTVAAAEEHYLLYGRTWERAAWMKARAAAGDLELGRDLLRRLAPFLWRRSIDFHTIDDIAAMRDRIGQAAREESARRDLKRGAGGIRELEFLVQAPQLVWAGRDPGLRVRGTVLGMKALDERGLLPEGSDAGELLDAWRLLRAVEHRLQWPDEAQTQRLPADGDGWAALAARLPQVGDRIELRLEAARACISAAWERLRLRADPERRSGPSHRLGDVEAGARARAAIDPLGDQGREEVLAGMGFPDPWAAAERVATLLAEARAGRMGEQGWRRFERVVPVLLARAARSSDPPAVLDRLGELVRRSGARGATWALLDAAPLAAETLVRLFDQAPFLAERFLRHPELLDALVLRGRGGERPPRGEAELWEELRVDLGLRHDEDERLAALRTFQTVELIRIALCDLSGSLPRVDAAPDVPHPHLRALARAVVRGAMAIAEAGLATRHGRLRQPDGSPVPLAVLGLGSLGSGWMGYGSDIDLAFLHGALDGASSDGPRPLDAGTWTGRFAQRVVTALSTQTPEGRCHDVDLRLRTDGSAGPIAVSVDAFVAYHRERSRPWEWVMLQRASVAAAEPAGWAPDLAALLLPVRARGPEVGAVVRAEAREMRGRQQAQRPPEGEDALDLKLGPGGLSDVEFAVAVLQVALLPGTPGAGEADPLVALGLLPSAGALPSEAAEVLATALLQSRRAENVLRRRHGGALGLVERAELERRGVPWEPLYRARREAARIVGGILGG